MSRFEYLYRLSMAATIIIHTKNIIQAPIAVFQAQDHFPLKNPKTLPTVVPNAKKIPIAGKNLRSAIKSIILFGSAVIK